MIRAAIETALRWMAALVSAAAIGAALLAGQPSLPAAGGPPPPAFPTRILFRRADPGPMKAISTAVIWSPVLFALPSPHGFSRLQPAEWTVAPPLDLPDPPPPVLVGEPSVLTATTAISRSELPMVWTDASLLPHRRLPPATSVVQAATGELPERAGWPLSVEEAGVTPWTATVQVQVAPEGWPVGIWLDSADAPTAARVLAVRRIAAWRWPPAGTSSVVVLRLTHPGADPRRRP